MITVSHLRVVTAAVATMALGLTGCAAATDPVAVPSTTPSTAAGESVQSTLDELPPEPGPNEAGTQAPQPPSSVNPAAEDCVSYDPANLTVTASGDAWILRDGSHAMNLFDTQTDAEDGRRVARSWKQLCFIGRGNDKSDRYRYIVTYWKSPSGLPPGPAPTFDCITYNPATLTIYSGAPHPADPTQDDWALYSGGTPLLFLASEPDALRAKLVAAANTRVCLIGHGNDRPDPARYVTEFWRQ